MKSAGEAVQRYVHKRIRKWSKRSILTKVESRRLEGAKIAIRGE